MAKANGHDDPRVTSLDDARRRAAEKAKSAPRAVGAHGQRTTRDWIIGGFIIAMAIGFVVSLVMRGVNLFGGG